MSAETNIAAASLVVALTALLIAGGQLLQAIFGNVPGYRRCAESVIGPWSKLRHRSWRWVEFRYEVEFEAPHFVILPPRIPNIDDHTYDLADQFQDVTGKNENHLRALKDSVAPNNRPTRGRYQAGMGDAEKHDEHYRQDEVLNLAKIVNRNETRVSWLQLLEAVHRTYSAYRPYQSKHSRVGVRSEATTAAVSIRKWSWDFMPVDLLKPLATSTLNNMILFALRLGMQWRRLDLENGIFLADGNGYNLTSLEIRGLGIVFTFKATGAHEEPQLLAPSKAVDKAMFGIISGCKELVRRDFHFVDPWRNLDHHSVFENMGIGDLDLRNKLVAGKWIEQHSDAIILLSSFMPMSGCSLLFTCLPEIRSGAPITPIHYWEGRLSLVESLRDRVEQLDQIDTKHHRSYTALKLVLERFEKLQQPRWWNDFLDVWPESVIEGSSEQKKLELVEECTAIFKWTTDYFHGQLHSSNETGDDATKSYTVPVPDWTESHRGNTRYVQLVAAHCIMVYSAVDHSIANFEQLREESLADERRRRRFDETMLSNRNYEQTCSQFQYHIARRYVACVKDGPDNVVGYLQERGVKWDVEDIEAAWWVMMLRGVTWDMSCVGDPAFRNKRHQWTPELVPSFFYDLQTPVWIT
ncbi:hypothetical protein DM02DRAFT_725149 [Periconia macrospinosa]|uniref:Uncharacterized protein n=1 Tax=Periconia macrospinosa TaxID=97972 RepID=A0A2V1E4F9_9PLEO|nr:hypothetical protein DM02DRAFT_725149 [Periconia macrospinosa]